MHTNACWSRICVGLFLSLTILALAGCAEDKKTVPPHVKTISHWMTLYCGADYSKKPPKCWKNAWCTCQPGTVE